MILCMLNIQWINIVRGNNNHYHLCHQNFTGIPPEFHQNWGFINSWYNCKVKA